MGDKVVGFLFDKWVGSDHYKEESFVESDGFRQNESEINGTIQGEQANKVMSVVTHMTCEAESAGFEAGFRYGVSLAADLLNDIMNKRVESQQ